MLTVFGIMTVLLGILAVYFIVITICGYSPISSDNKARLDAVDAYWEAHKDTPIYRGNYRSPSIPTTDTKFINHSTATYSAYSASK